MVHLRSNEPPLYAQSSTLYAQISNLKSPLRSYLKFILYKCNGFSKCYYESFL
jgi:hypothetical protein